MSLPTAGLTPDMEQASYAGLGQTGILQLIPISRILEAGNREKETKIPEMSWKAEYTAL